MKNAVVFVIDEHYGIFLLFFFIPHTLFIFPCIFYFNALPFTRTIENAAAFEPCSTLWDDD